MTDTSNTADLIESRDIIERIAELKAEWDENAEDDHTNYVLSGDDWAVHLGEGGAEELARLVELNEEGESYAGDWIHGATLIRDSYFETYARDFATDLGLVSDDTAWPASHIDWPAAAEALQIDYTEIDYDGESYWVRS